MAKGTTYLATSPDGDVFTRTSHRLYTHAVLVHRLFWFNDRDYLTRTNGLNPQLLEEATGKPSWGCYGWCGRPDLAERLARQAQKNLKPGDRVEIVALDTKA